MSSANTIRGIGRRSYHIISSANGSSQKVKQIPRKSSKNGFAALAAHEQTTQMSSARDIEVLLSNIGADYRVSRMTIESMMQGHSSDTVTKTVSPSKLNGNEIIDLIAQIRSL